MPKADQGIEKQRYQVVPRTLIFLFKPDGQVLLIKGANTKRLWAGLFNGIGGHVEMGEDVLESAYRELYEETGIDDVDLRLCGQIMVDVTRDTGIAIFVFRGEYSGNPLKTSNEGELFWIDPDHLMDTPMVEDLLVLLPKVAVHHAEDGLIFGKYAYDQQGDLKISFR